MLKVNLILFIYLITFAKIAISLSNIQSDKRLNFLEKDQKRILIFNHLDNDIEIQCTNDSNNFSNRHTITAQHIYSIILKKSRKMFCKIVFDDNYSYFTIERYSSKLFIVNQKGIHSISRSLINKWHKHVNYRIKRTPATPVRIPIFFKKFI
jgi:hypothetical protein